MNIYTIKVNPKKKTINSIDFRKQINGEKLSISSKSRHETTKECFDVLTEVCRGTS